MIKEIINELSKGNHFGVCKEVDIAKGLYKYETTVRGGFNKLRRVWLSKE